MWRSPDPFHPGRVIYWAERSGGIYLDEGSQPIYFEGTDPSRRGFPPPGEQLNVGTPRDRWVESLTPAQWYAYMGLQ